MNDTAMGAIRKYVQSGFYGADEIHQIVTQELFEPDEIDPDDARRSISEEFDRKREEERTWPAITDVDRLDAAFQELDTCGIIALHDAGFTQSEGLQEVSEVNAEAGDDSRYVGYCFYHFQDLERVLNGEGLMLSFGDIDGRTDEGLIIGTRIVEALTKARLETVWWGTIDQRINIPNIVWQNRGDGSAS